MLDEDFPVRRKKRFTGKKGVEQRKKSVEGQSGRKRENTSRKYISSKDVQRLEGSRKTLKWSSKHVVKKGGDALINRCHFFHCQKNSNIYSNTESVKKTFVKISQRMFSEIMPAFTEMFIMKTKNSEKCALFSSKCSRGALSIVDKIENWKNTKKKKLLPSMRRRKMKWNFMLPCTEYYFLGNLRTQKGYIAQWTCQGFQLQSELHFWAILSTK